MIRYLTSKDKSNFLYLCTKFHSDFYIIENNKKIFLTDLKFASQVFNSCIKHGNDCVVAEENNQFQGMVIILKNNNNEYELKLLTLNPKIGQFLIQFVTWHIKKEFFVTITKYNFLFKLCNERKYKFDEQKKFGFKFVKTNNKDITYKYFPNRIKEKHLIYKDAD